LISLFSRSSGFVLQIFFQCLTGSRERQQLRLGLAQQRLHARELPPSMLAITPSCSRTWSASGWAKIVHRRGHHVRRALGHPGQHVAQKVEL